MRIERIGMVIKSERIGDKKLRPKAELFCWLYSRDNQAFGNATLAYAKAYGIKIPRDISGAPDIFSSQYKTAKANGFKLLTNADILKRHKELLYGLISQETINAELVKVILQNGNLKMKIAGIHEFNCLRGRN